MTVYMTKAWSFDAPSGPLQFSENGWRANAIKVLKPGDLVLLVGTKQEPTAVADRNRLLGLMEPTTELVRSMDFDLRSSPEDFDKDGDYRWPFGLLNRAAWRISGPPVLLRDISDRTFEMDAVLGIVPLTEAEARKVLALPREEVELLPMSIRALERIGGTKAKRRTSPPPSFTRRSVMQMRREPAYTYAMEIAGATTPAFKIGWAFDHQRRANTFNRASMPALGGLDYRVIWEHRWDTAREAFAMEQLLLRQFDARRHPENHEVLVGMLRKQLDSAWSSALIEIGRRPRRAA